MRFHRAAYFLGVIFVSMSGCALCPPGYLEDYATVGGKWQRSDPTTGRVGSILSDPGSTVASGQPSAYYEGTVTYSDENVIYEGESIPSYDGAEIIMPDVGESVPAPVPDPMFNLGDGY